jgi:hypothetical protein
MPSETGRCPRAPGLTGDAHELARSPGAGVALGPALPWGDDDDLVPSPTAPYLRGFSAAMRDPWEAAFEGPLDRSVPRSLSGARSASSAGASGHGEAAIVKEGEQ